MTSTGKVLRVTSPLWRDCLKVFLKNLLEKIPVFSQPFPEFFLYIQTIFYFSLSWWSHTASVMLLSLTEHECFMRFSCQHLIILAYYIITLYHPFSPVKKKKALLAGSLAQTPFLIGCLWTVDCQLGIPMKPRDAHQIWNIFLAFITFTWIILWPLVLWMEGLKSDWKLISYISELPSALNSWEHNTQHQETRTQPNVAQTIGKRLLTCLL